MANALTNLYQNLKSKAVDVKNKVAKEAALFQEASTDTANKAFDATQSAIGKMKNQGTMISDSLKEGGEKIAEKAFETATPGESK